MPSRSLVIPKKPSFSRIVFAISMINLFIDFTESKQGLMSTPNSEKRLFLYLKTLSLRSNLDIFYLSSLKTDGVVFRNPQTNLVSFEFFLINFCEALALDLVLTLRQKSSLCLLL